MSRYKCHSCKDEHGTENVEAVCIMCFSRLRTKLEAAKRDRRYEVGGQINNRDFLIICATRYCLGRQSYVVSNMTDYPIKNAVKIHSSDRCVIIDDIDRQAQYGYGSDYDKAEWMKARSALEKADEAA